MIILLFVSDTGQNVKYISVRSYPRDNRFEPSRQSKCKSGIPEKNNRKFELNEPLGILHFLKGVYNMGTAGRGLTPPGGSENQTPQAGGGVKL